jgi:hypothetical protein
MTDEQFKVFINLLMCSDPFPCEGLEIMEAFADEEAQKRGYSDWIDAIHNM